MAVNLSKGSGNGTQPPEPAEPPRQQPRKVRLSKDKPTAAVPAQAGQIRVNLRWDDSGSPVDLDLSCFWALANGKIGCVQALGDKFTVPPHSQNPLIRLDEDKKSGGGDGENLFIDMSRAHHIRRILVYAHISDGVPNFAAAHAVATVYQEDAAPIVVELKGPSYRASVCTVALMVGDEAGGLTVRHEVRYFQSAKQMSDHYGWGLSFRPGQKFHG
ncbi:hypothetical protein Acor_09990 [Acrocarpospora corrugata]|uniref:Tellurium resistance protein TerA n=1 Tax=Acrocarpospora corrugata TaxID=35763 RepID=A0A5M3VQL1_9ACTN|nr:hypothetical protein [Acrocarpospora corrugata]GER98935.1 hypothetical protein Acor_09990 [Acrocarpospora corrugata]